VDDSSMVAGCWEFVPPTAKLRHGTLTGRVDVSHPERGLHQITVGAQRFGQSLLGVRRSDDPFGDRGHTNTRAGRWPMPMCVAPI
jgi:hypothetical protein